jgi:hypothetical protein
MGPLFVPQTIYDYGEPEWNDTNRVKPKNSEKSLFQSTLSTANPTWTDLGANTGLSCGEPATNRLSHVTAKCDKGCKYQIFVHVLTLVSLRKRKRSVLFLIQMVYESTKAYKVC